MTHTPGLVLMRDGAVARLHLDRPAEHQSVTRAMWRALPALLAQAEAAPEVKLVLLGSSTPGWFCMGADPQEVFAAAGNPALGRALADERQAALSALSGLSKPSIALVQGACCNEGLAMALACDLRFASEAAVLGMTQATLGLMPSFGELRALTQRVGVSHASDMAFSGRMLSATEAEQIGLVNDVWPAAAFDEALAEYVASVTRLSQYAVRGAKAMLRAVAAGQTQPTPELRAAFDQAFAGEDFREACAAAQAGRGAAFRWH